MKGVIYIIKNKINEKVYVGQTTMPIQERWIYHKRAARSKGKRNLKIYKAINEIGIDNFYYEIVEYNLEKEELDNKEIYYINLFDSFKNGYNSTGGGKGGKSITKDGDIKYIINEYNKGRSSVDIAYEFGVCGTTICRILKSLDIGTREDGRKLDESMLDDIKKLIKNNTYKQISDIYGVNVKTLGRFLIKHNIRQRKRRK